MTYFQIENQTKELFVLFHGTGGNEYSLLFLTGELNPHASIISFLGENDQGKNRRFFNALVDGVLDEIDFEKQTRAFLEEYQTLDVKNYQKVTFIGYSNGANFIQGILQKQPAIADQVILLHPQEFHLTFSQQVQTKPALLITTGASDTLAIAGDILKLKKRLQKTYPKTELLLTDGFHEVASSEVEQIKKWYQQKDK